jgi:hypothetical protein
VVRVPQIAKEIASEFHFLALAPAVVVALKNVGRDVHSVADDFLRCTFAKMVGDGTSS